MLRIPFRWLLPIAALAMGAGAGAQSAPAAAKADPLDARASVPPAVHRSAFGAYRGFADEKLVPWREANETVSRIGGWRAYAREASAQDAPSAAPGTPPEMPPGHSGHSGHQSP